MIGLSYKSYYKVRGYSYINLKTISILVLLLILSFPSLSYPGEKISTSTEGAKDEIRLALENWTKDFNEKKVDKICGLFAQDLIANYGDYPELSYESICTQLKSSLTMQDRTFNYTLDLQEIIVTGDLGVVRLIWTLEVSDSNGHLVETVKDRGIDIFRRQSDGKWRISRYIAYPMGER